MRRRRNSGSGVYGATGGLLGPDFKPLPKVERRIYLPSLRKYISVISDLLEKYSVRVYDPE